MDWVNQQEMAKILCTTAPTVLAMEKEGVITPAFRYKRTVRYDPEKVIEQLKAHREKESADKRKPRTLSTLLKASRGQ